MDLREYLFRKRISLTEFSEQIGYARTYMSGVVNGKKPGKKLAKAIEKATNGQVTVDELLSLKEIDKE
jgi:DNA-binding transcriptional regulator YdaS (Cro superfamily)